MKKPKRKLPKQLPKPTLWLVSLVVEDQPVGIEPPYSSEEIREMIDHLTGAAGITIKDIKVAELGTTEK